ncbi:MAG: alpha/beta hydrolase [Caulobacteraceae bacterium]|nr:alpha/beta hydrolase [Caulobacteraceae bacterium]
MSRRRLAAAAATAAALLAACGARDPGGAFVDSRPPPGLAERFHPPEGWAWGLVSTGGPLHRYGVAAPAAVAGADILVLPDEGETAETWFETIRELGGAGYTVWVLEAVGQGGSERLKTADRKRGDAGFADDVAAAQAMIGQVIRPRGPLILLGEGTGALIAARTVETGAHPAGLILSGSPCAPDVGLLRAWSAAADDAALGRTHDAWRGAVTNAWRRANPDLRPRPPTPDWRPAREKFVAETAAASKAIAAPTLILAPEGAPACLASAHAERRVVAEAGPALELEDDRRREGWLAAIEVFLKQVGRRPAIPQATSLFKQGGPL